MGDLGPIDCERRRGDEPFHDGGRALGLDLLSFWQWSTSDVVSNATRGVLAEYLVAGALGVADGCIREEWAAYDLEARDGTRVEVKSAAYIQSWHQERLSQISFLVPKTRGWDRDTNRQDDDPRRKADVYVFALLAHANQATLDPLDVSQWEFYVLPTRVLDDRERSQHSITLPSLRKLAGDAVDFAGLADAVAQAAGVQRRASGGPSGDAEETHKPGADATRVADYVRALPDFQMVEDLALPYNHMGATITDAVLQAGLRYETVVWPRVQHVMEAFPEAKKTSDFLAVLREHGGEEVVRWTHPEKLGRMEAVAELFIAEDIKTEADLRRWLCGDDAECRANISKLAAVRGIGPKTIDYFKILCGEQDTAAADVHLMRFLEQAAVHVSGYEQARAVIGEAATELGVSAALLDHSIWTYMSKTSGSCDDSPPPPALLVAGSRDEWGPTGGLTSLESCALDAARHELDVSEPAVRKAANISVRSERRAALLALPRRLDNRRSAAEKLAFQGVDPGSKEYSRATDRFNRSVGALRREIERHLDPAPEVPWREDSSLPQCLSADLEAAIEVLESYDETLPAGDWLPDTAGLARPGLCAWWVDGDGAAQLSRGLGSGLAVEADLIYVGQAEATEWPSGRRSVKTLATRVVAMDLNGHVRSSDLRLSLAAMLLDELGLAVMRPMLMTPESEDALSAWMKRHLCVAMHPVEDRDTLEDLERRVESALLDPPLNLQRRPDTAVRRRLIELRRRISQEET